MKNIKNRLSLSYRLIACLALILSISILTNQPIVHAAGTKTWSNADCTGIAPVSCSWSDANNWVGGILPVNGDDLVFDNATLIPGNSPTNDINGLAVNSVTFINAGSGINSIVLGSGLSGALTVNSAVSQSLSATTADLIKGTLILGGDVTFTGNDDNFTIGSSTPDQPNDTLNLNNHKANFLNVISPGVTPKITVNDIISGNGTVTFNGSNTRFVLGGLNTYSGITNVIASSTWVGGDVVDRQPFGTSTINVSSAAGIKFDYHNNVTLSNIINLTGGSVFIGLPISIYFANSGLSSMTFLVPHINLLGNVRLSNDTLATVNLTGVTANSHCIEYLTNGTIVNTPFTGGPGICVVPVIPPVSNTPKAPDTGLAYVGANPMFTLLVSVPALIVLIVSVRKLVTK